MLRSTKRSDALLIRDLYLLRICEDPGSAAHRFAPRPGDKTTPADIRRSADRA
jgi:hypothetical protein